MKEKKDIKFLSILIILTGIILTLENYEIIKGVSKHWPLLPVTLGTGFIILFFHKKRKDAGLLWLGSFFTATGVFCYYLNFTDWKRLAAEWPFFLIILSLSFLLNFIYQKKNIYGYISGLFLLLFIIFFLIFSISVKLWPAALTILGCSLLLIDYQNKKRK
ncbi:MAG TPA: hypothetical protein VKS21_01850 [Spirochaetota bacterium]|nr:hypothetical protein [Spirochaetota bacterium]